MSEEQLIATPSVFGENGNLIIERELGRGGMGGVYLGRDKMLDRPIAVKAMLREYGNDPEFVDRFKKEAQAAARLIHPNIAQIYSYGIYDGMPYIVMELVAGGSLDQLMRTAGKNTDVPRIMKICEQVAQALRCAADQGFVHGDVKPENVLLDANGNAKLVDFGLAAMQKDTTEVWGTPYYIAPEKVKKESVDYRADMFSLGGTIYHALCGVAPFEGEDATAVVRKRFEGVPAKPSTLRAGISPQIDFLVMKMLAMNPSDRYPTFEALLEDFKKVMTSGLSTTTSLAESQSSAAAEDSTSAAKPHLAKTAGGKKLLIKPKKKFNLKTTAAAASAEPESADEQDNGESEDEESERPSKKKKLKASKFKKQRLSNGGDDDYSDDEEEGGGMGMKVLLVIIAVIAAIGLVAGGLIWYQAADKKSRAEGVRAQIEKGFSTARESLGKTKEAATKFMEEFDQFAAEAVRDCQKPTDRLTELLSPIYADSVIASLKPAPTQELLDAIASTNAPIVQAESVTNLVEGVTNLVEGVTNAVTNVTNEVASATAEGATNAVASAEGEAPAAASAEGAEGEGEKPAAVEEAAAPSDGRKTEAPGVVREVNELWEKAYGCQAAAIRIRVKILKLLADIEEAEKITGEDEASMRKIANLANDLKARYDEIKASNDVTVVQKAKGFITSRGAKSVSETVRRLRELAAQKDREEKKKARLEAEEKRKAEMAAAHAKKIEEEIELAKDAYGKVISSGKIRQLDWKGAYRSLANVELTTAEAQIELKTQKGKIECMEFMHKTLIKSLPNYVFTRSSRDPKYNLRGAVVQSADATKIVVKRKGRSRTDEILWQTFFAKYHNSLDELISRFIVKNGAIGSEGVRLSKKERFDAMVGAAFIMRIVCADNPTAISYGEKLVKEAAKSFPAKFKTAKEYFPDIDFTDIEKEVEAENI